MRTVCDKDGQELALILDMKDYTQHEDKRFFSDTGDTLQVGSLFFSQGSKVEPHLHKLKELSDSRPMEVLLVLCGSPHADIYDESKQLVKSLVLKVGDILIQKCGGHGFCFPVKSALLEIKSGPYLGKDSDKEML